MRIILQLKELRVYFQAVLNGIIYKKNMIGYFNSKAGPPFLHLLSTQYLRIMNFPIFCFLILILNYFFSIVCLVSNLKFS